MAGYLGTKAVLLSTTAADVIGNAEIGGDLTVGGNITSTGIDDNASSTAITIDSSGDVGIGEASPSAKLDVSGTTTGVLRIKHNYSYSQPNWAIKIDGEVGTPAGYLSQSGASGGFALTSGGVYYGGGNYKADANATAFGGIQSTGGAFTFTNATGLTGGQVFSGSQVMNISSTGTIDLGPGPGAIKSVVVIPNYSAGSALLYWNRYDTTATSTVLRFDNQGVAVGSITHSNSSTSYNTSSDYRLKTDAQPMTGASARVQALKPVNFEWIANGTRVDGFLAHEAQEVVPEAVTGTKDAMRDEEYEVTPAVLDDDGNVVTEAVMGTRSVPDYQGIDQSKLVPLLTAALQEALTEIADLKARVTALEAV